MNKFINKKYPIFISSTFSDLEDQRDQVIKAILEMGHIPVGMEMFSAGDEEQWKLIQRTIDECDYYVVILANRYGSEVDGISYTEREYDYAIQQGVPVIALILDEKAPWPSEHNEDDPKKSEKLKVLKEKVRKKTVSFWKNTEDLYGKTSIALMKAFNINPQIGWIRADKITSEESTEEILRLSKEVDSLKKEIKQYKEKLGEAGQSYAQGNERITLNVKLDILDANSNSYNRTTIRKAVKTSLSTDWISILSIILPQMVSFPGEESLKGIIGRIVSEKISETDVQFELPSHYAANARPTSETYNLIKVQLLALGFAEIYEDDTSTKPQWRLTEAGKQKMYFLLAQKSQENVSMPMASK